jgi:hypothetical protein
LFVAFAYTHGNGNRNTHGNRNAHCNGNGVSISNANGNTWRQNYPHTAAAPHTGSPAVSLGAYLQISSGTREAIREFPEKLRVLYLKVQAKR